MRDARENTGFISERERREREREREREKERKRWEASDRSPFSLLFDIPGPCSRKLSFLFIIGRESADDSRPRFPLSLSLSLSCGLQLAPLARRDGARTVLLLPCFFSFFFLLMALACDNFPFPDEFSFLVGISITGRIWSVLFLRGILFPR